MAHDIILGTSSRTWSRGDSPAPRGPDLNLDSASVAAAACGIWPLALGLSALGLGALALKKPGEPHVWTPSAARAELERVRRVLDVLADDMAQALRTKQITSREFGEWTETRRAVARFLAKASPYWGSNVRIAREQEKRLEPWRAFLRRRGASVTDIGPGTSVPWHRALLLPALAGGLVTAIIALKARSWSHGK